MDSKSYKSFINELYPVTSVKKKMVHVMLDEWMVKQLEEIQSIYKEATGNDVSTAQIIRKAIVEHTGKTLKTVRWYKTNLEK